MDVFLQIIRDRNWIPNGEDEVKVLDDLMMEQIRSQIVEELVQCQLSPTKAFVYHFPSICRWSH